MSASDGSNWFVKVIVAGEPSLTGLSLPRSAVGVDVGDRDDDDALGVDVGGAVLVGDLDLDVGVVGPSGKLHWKLPPEWSWVEVPTSCRGAAGRVAGSTVKVSVPGSVTV